MDEGQVTYSNELGSLFWRYKWYILVCELLIK